MTTHEVHLEVSTLYQQAIQLEDKGNQDLAQQRYQKILELAPQHMGALLNLANLLIKQDLLVDAIPLYEVIRQHHPENPKFLQTLGDLYFATGNFEKSITAYKGSLTFSEQRLNIFHKIISVYLKLNDILNAIAYLNWGHNEHPEDIQTLLLLGKCFHSLGRKAESTRYFEMAYLINTKNADAGQAYADTLVENNEPLRAIPIYQSILEMIPEKDKTLDKIGKCLNEVRQYQKAKSTLLEAIEVNPSNYSAHYHLGNTFASLGKHKDAATQFEKSIQLMPELPEAQYNLGLANLALGNYKKGYELYSWRWSINQYKKDLLPFPYPVWDGAYKAKLKLLIWDEQGIGDSIFFSQALQEIVKTEMNLTLLCENRLIPIIKRSFPSICVYPKPKKIDPSMFPPNQYDAQIPIGDLIYYTSNYLTEKRPEPYFIPNNEISHQIKKNYPHQTKIGISWHTKATLNGDLRSIPLSLWSPVFKAFPEICWVNLQYGHHDAEWSECVSKNSLNHVNDKSIDPLKDMEKFASQMDALDAIISIDNSTAHLAGALGKPSWLLLPTVHDWRWPKDGKSCPWYHQMKILRKEEQDSNAKNVSSDWNSVFTKLIEELSAFLNLENKG